jgi:hypothetical protein
MRVQPDGTSRYTLGGTAGELAGNSAERRRCGVWSSVCLRGEIKGELREEEEEEVVVVVAAATAVMVSDGEEGRMGSARGFDKHRKLYARFRSIGASERGKGVYISHAHIYQSIDLSIHASIDPSICRPV